MKELIKKYALFFLNLLLDCLVGFATVVIEICLITFLATHFKKVVFFVVPLIAFTLVGNMLRRLLGEYLESRKAKKS